MGTIKTKHLTLILFLSSTWIYSSCSKDEEKPFDETEAVFYQSEENFENAFSTINTIANAGIRYAESQTSAKIAEEAEFACAQLDFEGTKEMGRLEVDYGTGGCKGQDGRVRKGKVVIEYSGKRIFYGSVVYTTLTDFHLDQYKIEGTLKSENISTDPEKPKFRVTITNGKFVWPDESFATWQMDRTHTWTYSGDLQSIQLSITGTSMGRTTSYEAFASEILEPLIYHSECTATGNYIPIEGMKKISLAGEKNIHVDYGSGDCDRMVTITINEKSQEVYL